MNKNDNFINNQKGCRNMSILKCNKFKGCEKCKLLGCDCRLISVPVKITFKKDEKADNWGRIVTVFRKGETVKGYAVVDNNNVVYCASAESNIYNYEDFISLENVDIELIESEVEK